jgi:bifunctional ADP-heptose synthase (sugar kinase/adenylyltransferase)
MYIAKIDGLRIIRMFSQFDQASTTQLTSNHDSYNAGTTLVVGVNNDESITICKGKPVTSEVTEI